MYVPEHFAYEDREQVLEFVRRYAFAVLVSVDGGIPFATHLPLIVKESERAVLLEGHVAAGNPHRTLLGGGQHLAIFNGPHAYVSPTWYRDPGVPTWNYVAVHMSGPVELVENPRELAGIVGELATRHEQDNPTPWDQQYGPTMLRSITGFRMTVERISGKRKLSQNRTREDRLGVTQALERPFGREPDTGELNIRQLMLGELDA